MSSYNPVAHLSLCVILWETICFFTLRPFPTPFSSTDAFVHMFGATGSGFLFLSCALMSGAAHFITDYHHLWRMLLLTPQHLIMQGMSWIMIVKMFDGDARVILGSGYIIPPTIFHAIMIIRGGR